MTTKPRGQSGLGLLMLAIGRKRGFGYFGTGKEAYLNSLAPLLAFGLVSGAVTAIGGKLSGGLLMTLVLVVTFLTPAVVAHALCRFWAREASWALYANLLNWAQLLCMVAVSVFVTLGKLLGLLGMPGDVALALSSVGLLIYVIWFHWFLARGALRLSRLRTLALLVTILVCTDSLVYAPLYLGGDLADIVPPITDKAPSGGA